MSASDPGKLDRIITEARRTAAKREQSYRQEEIKMNGCFLAENRQAYGTKPGNELRRVCAMLKRNIGPRFPPSENCGPRGAETS